MRRWLVAITTALVVTAAAAASLRVPVPSATARAARTVLDQRAVSSRQRPATQVAETAARVEVAPAVSARVERLARRRAASHDRVMEMVASGELTEAEGAVLHGVAERGFGQVRELMRRADDGEFGGLGLLLRTVPLRLRSAGDVVFALGAERAQEVGALWRERARQERARERRATPR